MWWTVRSHKVSFSTRHRLKWWNTALTRQLSNAMIAAGLIISPDISKYLDYLQGAGYIEFTEEKVTAYNAYANDAVIKLTKAGVDLAEGTTDDNGVDI